MAQVSAARCVNYRQEEVNAAVAKVLGFMGGMEQFIKPGQRVLLKVNALTMKLPEEAVTTHPVVIKAVAGEVKRAGGIPVIGDSSGGMIAGQAPTAQTFRVAGMVRAAEEAEAELVNFDTTGVRAVESDGPIGTLYLATPVLDADVVISLPKLKTHSATILTGAVKNMYGCVPGHRKAEYHRMAPDFKDFARVLVDVYEATRPALTIMDGIVGMEGNGPSGGSPRNTGIVLAAQDAVALDAVVANLVGLAPFKVHTTRIAHDRGLGVGDMNQIEIVGEEPEAIRIRDFDLPSNIMMEAMPGFIVRGLLGLLRARPEITESACAGCSFCVSSCPVQAIEMPGNVPCIDYEKCISCLCCQELCPQRAVQMKQVHPVGRMLAGMVGHVKRRKRRRYRKEY